MKESVAELLQLVGSRVRADTVESKVSPRPAKPANAAAPSATRLGLMNGNGHSHPTPKLAPAAKRRGEIPLGGDFKDF